MSARHQCEASTWRHEAHFAALISTLRFLVNSSRNSQHFRIPTQPVISVVKGQFSDFYSAVIIRQGLFSPSVQPLFDLVLKLHGLAMSGLAISASPSKYWLLKFDITKNVIILIRADNADSNWRESVALTGDGGGVVYVVDRRRIDELRPFWYCAVVRISDQCWPGRYTHKKCH